MTAASDLDRALVAHAALIFEEAETIVWETGRAVAPFDTGELRRSGDVTTRRRGPDRFETELEFKAEHADYLDDPRGNDGPRHIRSTRPGGKLRFVNRFGQTVYARRVRVSFAHQGWFTDNVADWWRAALTSAQRRVR